MSTYIPLTAAVPALHALPALVAYGKSPHQDSGFQRVWLKQNLDFKGWNSHVHGEPPRSFESRNLSRDNLSREIGRTCMPSFMLWCQTSRQAARCAGKCGRGRTMAVFSKGFRVRIIVTFRALDLGVSDEIVRHPSQWQASRAPAEAGERWRSRRANGRASRTSPEVGRGDDTVGDPHRAGISQLELFELILLLKLDKYFSIEQFEPTVSQSTVSSPPLTKGW